MKVKPMAILTGGDQIPIPAKEHLKVECLWYYSK